MRVLDVGSSNVPLTADRFAGWQRVTIDMDEEAEPDVVGDVRELEQLCAYHRFNAVYASHFLEHLFPWEVVNVLRQFASVLAPDGWVEVWVPDVMQAMAYALEHSISLSDTLYEANNGARVTLLDMLYGWEREVRKGKPGFAHQTAFDWPLLEERLREAGYPYVQPVDRGNAFEIGYCAWFGRKPGWLENGR